MGMINLEDLRLEMVLTRDVVESSGELLAAAGERITERHLRIFKKWGIAEVEVEGVTREDAFQHATEQLDTAAFKEAEAAIRELFRHTDLTNPAIGELMRICTLRRLQHRQGGRA
jgi:hypothetical protein